MKVSFFFKTDIQEDIRKKHLASVQFKNDLILENIQRGRLLGVVIVCFEAIFLVIDIVSSFLEVNNTFSYTSYMVMYFLMIVFNLLYLFLINGCYQNKISLGAINIYTVIYLILIMVWGSIISLMDQKLYGQLMSSI